MSLVSVVTLFKHILLSSTDLFLNICPFLLMTMFTSNGLVVTTIQTEIQMMVKVVQKIQMVVSELIVPTLSKWIILD
ncbi:hypothetical protein D3C80_1903760 [compost metagenome]